MNSGWKVGLAGLLFAVALVAASCGSGGGIQTTLQDFSITMDPVSASAGEMTFEITNAGPSVHEFVVLSTDLASGALPTDDTGSVDEAGAPGITLVDEVEDIAAEATPSLTVQLDPGSYVMICNLPGHYGQGMHASFTVS
jgi:uncharacterized cupredoxin-like copper-binding protein